jgi:flagellar protein FliO/FliZ
MAKIAIILLMSILCLPHLSAGAEAAVPPPAQVESLEHSIIRRSGSLRPATQPGSTTTAVRTNNGLDVKRVTWSLAIVLGLILALRWGGRILFPSAKSSRSSRAVQVLSRNILSPKQQVLVLQVGRRVVVVGDTGQQMNPLCEITDPDEVAALIGQIREGDRDPMTRTFSNLFGRAGASYSPPTDPTDPEQDARAIEGRDDSVDVGLEDPALSATRQEINGLMDKVRLVARQFSRS